MPLFAILFRVGFPGGSDGKASACNTGDPGLIPGLRRSPGEGNGKPIQYSYRENPVDKEPGRLQSMESQSQTRLSDFTFAIVQSNSIFWPFL